MGIQKDIRELIKEHGLTPYQVAKALGIDHASLYKSLEDSANPGWNTIKKVLDHLGYEVKLTKRREVKSRKPKPSKGRRKEKHEAREDEA